MNREHETETVASESPNLKQKVAARIAPAVALLLWGEQVFAESDFVDDGDLETTVPEPTTLALLAAGAAGAAIAAGIKKRRKK